MLKWTARHLVRHTTWDYDVLKPRETNMDESQQVILHSLVTSNVLTYILILIFGFSVNTTGHLQIYPYRCFPFIPVHDLGRHWNKQSFSYFAIAAIS